MADNTVSVSSAVTAVSTTTSIETSATSTSPGLTSATPTSGQQIPSDTTPVNATMTSAAANTLGVGTSSAPGFTFSFSKSALNGQSVPTTQATTVTTTITSVGTPVTSGWPTFTGFGNQPSGSVGYMPPWGMGYPAATPILAPPPAPTQDIAVLLANMQSSLQASLQASIDSMSRRVAALESTPTLQGTPGTNAQPAAQPTSTPPQPASGPPQAAAQVNAAHQNGPTVGDELRQLGIYSSSSSSSSDNDNGSSDSSDEASTATSKKKKGKHSRKSGRAKTTEDFIIRDVPWPHYGVYKGAKNKPADYDELSLAEFVYGYVDMLRRNKKLDTKTKGKMLAHLQDLMEDAISYPWSNVRNFHGVMLGEMERDLIDWGDTKAINKLRVKYSQRQDNSEASNKFRHRESYGDKNVCENYQKGTCPHEGDHSTSKGQVRHVCAYCLKVRHKAFVHMEKGLLLQAQQTPPHTMTEWYR